MEKIFDTDDEHRRDLPEGGISLTTASTQTTSGSNGLNQNSFLQLLTMQMKYQDPLSPQSGTQFVAQLAQFTALEQMTNVATASQSILSDVSAMESMIQMSFAHQLIGANVTVDDSNGKSVSGTVSSVHFSNGNPEVVVNGSTYPLSSVVKMG